MTSWVHPDAMAHFERYPEEEDFAKHLGDVFEVSFASRYQTKKSEYSYYLLKPHPKPAARFGLSQMIALYSPYPDVQARVRFTLQELAKQWKERVHPVWAILVTDSDNTVEEYENLVAGKDSDPPYAVPFGKNELVNYREGIVQERLESYIFGRDLFAFESPLSTDAFFFGRDRLVNELVGKIENAQNFGMFGLRKAGKTSVLLAVKRRLETLQNYQIIHFDCQQANIYDSRWDVMLARIHQAITKQYPHLGSADQIVEDLARAIEASPKRIVVFFDEIEYISFELSPSRHWNSDFIPFWGTMRALHQRYGNKFTFGIVGVNPRCVESALVFEKENPIFQTVTPIYLPPLEESDVRKMVRTVGAYIGLRFDEEVYKFLADEFGSHPFLIRQTCSFVYQDMTHPQNSTIAVDDFVSRSEALDRQHSASFQKILIVLALWYPGEYTDLLDLARGEHEWIKEVRAANPDALNHLFSYGIIREDEEGQLSVTLKALQRYLVSRGQALPRMVETIKRSGEPISYEDLPTPDSIALWLRLSEARNTLEPRLRTLIYRTLTLHYGSNQALLRLLDTFDAQRRQALEGHSLDSILGGKSRKLYLKDLKEIICREWDLFKHVFENDKKAFELRMDIVNQGRADAHANPVEVSEVEGVERTVRELLGQVEGYLLI